VEDKDEERVEEAPKPKKSTKERIAEKEVSKIFQLDLPKLKNLL
jgi:hypothetical protein